MSEPPPDGEEEDRFSLLDEDEEDDPITIQDVDGNVDWQRRCFELEISLRRFRAQATRIREVLRDKLADLERRVVDAEKRAESAEERAQLMEQRLLESGETGSLGGQESAKIQQKTVCINKDPVICTLEQEVEEQKKLRIQDAKQVEAKAAKIKEWVTNKLKELEEQNQHLREQNQKCNEQIELLRNRLVQLSQINYNTKAISNKDRTSIEQDSSRGSFEDRGESDDSLPPEAPDQNFSTPIIVNNTAKNQQPDSNHLYSAVDLAKKRSPLSSAPPRVKIERKKYDDNHVSLVSSTASEDPCESDGSHSVEGSPITPPTGMPDGKKKSPHRIGGRIRTNGSPTSGATRSHIQFSPARERHSGNNYGSLDRKMSNQRKLNLSEVRGGSERKKTIRTDNEVHDYAEIYTPSKDLPDIHCHSSCDNLDEPDGKPPTPPLHRFPSWESKIYEIAVNGITVPEFLQVVQTGSPNNNSKLNNESYVNGGFPDLNIPVYATVKGRASQIRSVPFTGESSDSSDNEDARVTTNSSHTTSGETESSHSTGSPSKGGKTGSILSPTPLRTNLSPTKSVRRDASVESVLSDDYAIPPDAISTDALSVDSVEPPTIRTTSTYDSCKRESLEKSGYLTKLGGKLKTWRRRWFVLKNGTLSYCKTQNDINRKPQGQIILNDVCRVTRAEGAATFEISTGKRTYYLTADSVNTMEEWIKVLQNVLRRNATRLLLSKEDNRPTIEGWLTKVKHGHSRRCWCVLIGRMFLYFKTPNDTSPLGQINMRDARAEEVVHVSDSDEEDHDENMTKSEYTVGIFPNHQGPTYLLMNSKQELESWLYHLMVVASGENFVGTQFEQLVAKLMEVDGDENNVIWRHPLLLYSKDNISQPLTTLPSEMLQVEAVKLFKSIQLFISVPMDTSGIDYHVALAQNSLHQCLLYPDLQNELFCQLIKQTSRHSHHKIGVQQLLLCATQSLFLCDTSSSEKSSPTSTVSPDRPPPAESKLNPAPFVFVQSLQLLALAITLFIPKNRTLWFLRLHLQRNPDPKSEAGKYMIFCQRALERTLQNGARECKPSRMEVLSILLKNPYHHSLPHSIPVHFLNGTYQVVGFDGSSTVEEFITTLNSEAGIRDSVQSGFALFTDDPIDKAMEHCLQNSAKLCDVISKWEQALREKHLGKFENTKVLKLTYKNRLTFRQLLKAETDKERILTAYQINEEITQSRFPITKSLALELAALMAQIEFGDYNSEKGRGSGTGTPANPQHQLQQVVERFFPPRYRDPQNDRPIQESIREKWITLKGRNILDCVRIYLNCARKWSFCGARLFTAKVSQLRSGEQPTQLWMAVTEDSVALLDYISMQPLARYPYAMVMTFGGCRDDFMLVVSHPDGDVTREGQATERLLFAMPKPKILEITLLIADYMNAMGRCPIVPPSPQTSTLSRLEKIRAKIRANTTSCSVTSGSLRTSSSLGGGPPANDSPDLLKMTAEADGRLLRSDSKKRAELT